jgi:hypothetical protein
VKKKRLKVENNISQDHINLYSIASSESDIRICFIINQTFGIDLSLAEDLIVQRKDTSWNFRNYFFERDHYADKFYFIINRDNGSYLLPELNKVDYLFLIISESGIADLDLFILKLKKQPEISAVIPIDPGKIRSFNKLKF